MPQSREIRIRRLTLPVLNIPHVDEVGRVGSAVSDDKDDFPNALMCENGRALSAENNQYLKTE